MGVHRPEVSARKRGGSVRGFLVGVSVPPPADSSCIPGLHSAAGAVFYLLLPKGLRRELGDQSTPLGSRARSSSPRRLPDPSAPRHVSPSSPVVLLPGRHHKAPASTPTKGPVFSLMPPKWIHLCPRCEGVNMGAHHPHLLKTRMGREAELGLTVAPGLLWP